MNDKLNALRSQCNQILIGKEDKITLVLCALLSKGHILLEDVPGVGKTTLASGLAKSIAGNYGRIQFTPDTLPSDVTGISIYRTHLGDFEYLQGPIMNHILLADEINRTSAKTQAALLEVMEEGTVTVDGITHALPTPFLVIATQNPIDFVGTYNLPEAQLDRFLMHISLGYPGNEDERRLAKEFLDGKRQKVIEAVIDCDTILQLQREVEQVHVHADLVQYVVDLMQTTRNTEYLSLGASPRATLALLSVARAYAYLHDRDFVTPDDIRAVQAYVLCHRFVLSTEARMKKMGATEILRELCYKVPVPVLRTNFS